MDPIPEQRVGDGGFRCEGPLCFRAWLAALIALVVVLPARAGSSFDLAAAIRSAGPGATIEVPAGTYRGPFVLEQPIRLLGAPGAILDGGGQANVVEIRAPDVELAGFVIRNSSSDIERDRAGVYVVAPRATIRDNTVVDCLHGIYLKAANDVRILHNVIRGRAALETVADPIVSGLKLSSAELCSSELEQNQRGNGIHLWKSLRTEITDNDIRGTRDGIYFSFSDQTQVRRNRISQVRYGLHYMYSDENLFEGNTFADNAAGAALMFSADIVLRGNRFTANRTQRSYGLLLQTVDRTVIEHNVMEGNTVGLYLESNHTNTVRNNEIAGNYIGLRISDSSGDNTFSGNSFVRNVHPVEMSGASEGNHWTAGGRGNHWDGALTLDLNRDGVADVAHREVDVFGSWRREFPAIGLLSGSPGERLIRFIYSRVPVRGLLGVTDARPLVRAPAP
ncbi:NosD domain-containing protein [Opitutus terrae]|uniref:NosD domain-containing protein n=1 Tax=Opitutus terrae TaxID=107709 RepID=UPI001ED96F82|nr:NosD domain-containing protein [Opitutus terrae]